LTYEQLKRRSEQEGTPLPAVEDAEAIKHTYAPRDTKMLLVSRKDDFHGLGYTPAMGLRSSGKHATDVSGPRLSCMSLQRIVGLPETD
jgi:G patch domain-containing protein 1